MDVITIAHYSHNICTFFSAVSQPNCHDIVIVLHWKCFLPSTSASDQKCAAFAATLLLTAEHTAALHVLQKSSNIIILKYV